MKLKSCGKIKQLFSQGNNFLVSEIISVVVAIFKGVSIDTTVPSKMYSVFARSPLSTPNSIFFSLGLPFVVRSVLIGCECPGLQMVDLSERENGRREGERGEIVQTKK